MTPESIAPLDPALTMSVLFFIFFLALWDMVWKGIALRKAGSKRQLAWFICLFIFNTLGILPILYLIFWQKKDLPTSVKSLPEEKGILTKTPPKRIIKKVTKKTKK